MDFNYTILLYDNYLLQVKYIINTYNILINIKYKRNNN